MPRGQSVGQSSAEEGEAAPAPLQKAEGRWWWIAPAGKLSSSAQSYEALHHFQ
jgi:hypothetical protein